MLKLPESYLEEMKELLKDEFDAYLNSFSSQRTYGLRINTSKISVADFLKISPFPLQPIPWTDDGFYYPAEVKPARHPYYHAGLYYLQEPSAMLPAQLLPIEAGDYVLDACAAPGGKSAKLADKLQGTGILIANDISVSRAQILLKTLETQGVRNAFVMAEDIMKLNGFENRFDKILIDAPCSGEGMFRKEPELIRAWLEKDSSCYAPIQKRIMEAALGMLKPGGQLLYSTCTFSVKEDEEIVEHALKICPELKVVPIEGMEGFAPGLTENTSGCVRLYPHRIAGEGHFVALLKKGGNPIGKTQRTAEAICQNLPEEIRIRLYDGSIEMRENKVYFLPDHDLDLQGLRILRSGLYLGEYRHGRFEPSQALAMASKEEEYGKVLNFSLDDPRILRYLKGETLSIPENSGEGYHLVCCEHFPLGFGILKDHMLKNRYPANYRYM